MSATILAATPLLFTGLCAAAAFRMGVFNIGGEGQFIMGAISAGWVGLATGDRLGAASLPLMVLAGIVAGALWAGVAGVLKAFFRTNEIIVTLMLNYIAGNIAYYLIFNSDSYWRLLTGSGRVFPQGRPIDPGAEWPFSHIGSVDIPFGFWLGVVAAVVTWLLYRSTRYGFEVRVISDAPAAAKYAGMRTRRKVVAVMALSGALAGLGGASDIGDIRHVLDPKGLRDAHYGYTGIVVAALARLNPLGCVLVSILMGGLNNAGRSLQGPDFPAGLVGTLQGLILFFALGGEVLARYRIRWQPRTVAA
jgi:simple sugar transport system permease protein